MQLFLYPALVQGDGAAATIVKGIETLDKMGMDTIIIGRGGGSIEDLWPFNEESVARAIYHAKTPIISGTGHEIDNTIADYVSDLRAPTPSAACELAIPDIMTSLQQVQQYEISLKQSMRLKYHNMQQRFQVLSAKLNQLSPENTFQNQKVYMDALQDRLIQAMQKKYENRNHRYELLLAKLNGLSPTAKLVGGYGYIEKKDGDCLQTVNDVQMNDTIQVTVWDGSLEAVVTKITK